MKVLTFSRHFPKGHPKAGLPTYFVEKIEACLADTISGWQMSPTFMLHDWLPYYNCTMPKQHTIRAGNRWKPGDLASLRVWSGLPYRSRQIEFAQVEVKKVWAFEINDSHIFFDGWNIGPFHRDLTALQTIARNDGLECQDFVDWFNVHPKKDGETFKGQVICWNEKIDYGKSTLTEKIEQ